MKVVDVLNQKVTVIRNVSDYKSHKSASIGSILFNLCPKWKEQIKEARKLRKESKSLYDAYRKKTLPVWFPHGVTGIDDKDANMVSFSNIIALDIDVKDGKGINEGVDLDDIRKKLMTHPSVFAALKSTSGEGIYVLVAVEDHTHTRGYYEWWKGILKDIYSIDLDMAATNLARKRFISWEDGMEDWIKPLDAEITPWKLYLKDTADSIFTQTPSPVIQEVRRRVNQTNLFGEDEQTERTRLAIKALIDSGLSSDSFFHSGDGAYGHWWHIGNNIKYFFNDAEGEQLFIRYSQNSSTYHDDDKTCIECFKRCDGNKALNGCTEDDLHRKWQGMAKNRLGAGWWRNNK